LDGTVIDERTTVLDAGDLTAAVDVLLAYYDRAYPRIHG
jgi:hypothetical protein